MPRGEKNAYTGQQKRRPEHVEQSELAASKSGQAAEHAAWVATHKQDTGKKPTSQKKH